MGLIHHVTLSPFQADNNGQAERMGRTTKDALKQIVESDWDCHQLTLPLTWHITPGISAGQSHVELLMKRHQTTFLDCMHPNLSTEC